MQRLMWLLLFAPMLVWAQADHGIVIWDSVGSQFLVSPQATLGKSPFNNLLVNPDRDPTGSGHADTFAVGIFNNGAQSGLLIQTERNPAAIFNTFDANVDGVVMQLVGGIGGYPSTPYIGHVLEIQDNTTGEPTMFVTNNGTITAHTLILTNLPKVNPHIKGALWNSGGILKVSAGP
jgi:hypothetical protein